MVKYQLAKRRAGTHKTLSRGEVARTARSSTSRRAPAAPVTARPTRRSSAAAGTRLDRLPRDYGHDLAKKFRALALRHALSAKANAGDIVVIDALHAEGAKTSALTDSRWAS